MAMINEFVYFSYLRTGDVYRTEVDKKGRMWVWLYSSDRDIFGPFLVVPDGVDINKAKDRWSEAKKSTYRFICVALLLLFLWAIIETFKH